MGSIVEMGVYIDVIGELIPRIRGEKGRKE